MARIDQLSRADTLASGDLIPVHQEANDDTRAVTVGTFAARISELIEGEPDQTVYALAMSGASFNASVLPSAIGGSAWLQVSLSTTAPNGTISLPDINNRANGQEVLVTVNQPVTVLTVLGMGAAVLGVPTSLGAYGFFRVRYDIITNCWYRVG